MRCCTPQWRVRRQHRLRIPSRANAGSWRNKPAAHGRGMRETSPAGMAPNGHYARRSTACRCSIDRKVAGSFMRADGTGSSGCRLPREGELSMSRHGLRSRQLSTSLQHYRSFHEPDGNPIRASPFGTIRKGSKFPELILTIRESGNIVTVPTYCLLAT